MDKDFKDIPSFFTTWQEGQTFYRPLSREIFNLFMYKSFGLNPLPFHLVNFIQILVVSYLSFILIKKIINNKFTALLAVFFYLVSAVHSIELYYLGSVQQLFATIFLLAGLLFYLQFQESKKLYFVCLSFIFYLLALLSHGMAVMFPVILLVIEIFSKKRRRRLFNQKHFLVFILFFGVDLVYVFYSSLLTMPSQTVYQPVISLKTSLNTLFWYIAWSFNLPEMLVDFIGPGGRINPNLVKWYGNYLFLVLPLLLFFVFSLVVICINFYSKLIRRRELYILAAFFMISLSPFLIFPKHKFIFYMNFSTVWFAALLALLFTYALKFKYFGKVLVVCMICVYLIISYQTIQINKITYWAAKRSQAAQYLMAEMKRTFKVIPKGQILYIRDDPLYPNIAKEWGSSSKQAFYILSGADAFKLLYKNPGLQVYFEGFGGLPEYIDKSKVINYIAKFPY